MPILILVSEFIDLPTNGRIYWTSCRVKMSTFCPCIPHSSPSLFTDIGVKVWIYNINSLYKLLQMQQEQWSRCITQCISCFVNCIYSTGAEMILKYGNTAIMFCSSFAIMFHRSGIKGFVSWAFQERKKIQYNIIGWFHLRCVVCQRNLRLSHVIFLFRCSSITMIHEFYLVQEQKGSVS